MATALLWYRRDLRLHDHPALTTALREYERVVPVFVLDDALLHGRFASTPRTHFMLGCLRALDEQLRARNSALVVRRGRPEQVLVQLAGDAGAEAALWTSDAAPYARARDRRVTDALRRGGVAARPHGGTYVVDVAKPRTQAGAPYHVFSPFFRTWRHLERRAVQPAPPALPGLPANVIPADLPASPAALGLERAPGGEPIVAPGEPTARQALERWLQQPIDAYAQRHDSLALVATSVLSPYLRWGCLSPREAEQRARERGGDGAAAWVRQLAFRDFYAHVLLMWPGNVRHEFQERLRTLRWDDARGRLEAWRRGETGYPVVDAAMRQLASDGWMPNRARLIVGSFLTKDLHLDWREGERWFERLLLDGEPAQNNGNWQWIASVGTDPAPAYRRMYNPTLQGRRFDPRGEYVRRWIPELRDLPDDSIHEPWTLSEAEQRAAGCRIGCDYPERVVDHARERERALERYRAAAA